MFFPVPDIQFVFGHIWTNKLRRLTCTWFDKANAARRFPFSMTIHLNVHGGSQNNPFPHSSHAWLECAGLILQAVPQPLTAFASGWSLCSHRPFLRYSCFTSGYGEWYSFPKVFFVNKLRSNTRSEFCERSSLSIVGTLPFMSRKCRMNEND